MLKAEVVRAIRDKITAVEAHIRSVKDLLPVPRYSNELTLQTQVAMDLYVIKEIEKITNSLKKEFENAAVTNGVILDKDKSNLTDGVSQKIIWSDTRSVDDCNIYTTVTTKRPSELFSRAGIESALTAHGMHASEIQLILAEARTLTKVPHTFNVILNHDLSLNQSPPAPPSPNQQLLNKHKAQTKGKKIAQGLAIAKNLKRKR